jgi:hypothetical protein
MVKSRRDKSCSRVTVMYSLFNLCIIPIFWLQGEIGLPGNNGLVGAKGQKGSRGKHCDKIPDILCFAHVYCMTNCGHQTRVISCIYKRPLSH